MSYKLPLKQSTEKSKWLTATLVCIYVLIAALVFLNS
jgi:hypothetical protein